MCNEHRVWEVTFTLWHFLSIWSQNNTVYNKILEWFLLHNSCWDNHQGIEPTSCLIETFGDEISWESLVESFFIHTEWIMNLWEWHTSWFKPAIEHLWNSCNSLMEPTQIISYMSSLAQIGIGLPQYLFLEKHQSFASASQLWNLFSWTNAGTHLEFWLFFNNWSLISVTLMNQVSIAL